MGVEFREVADDNGPSTLGFGPEGGKAVCQFFVDDEDLEAAIIELLGDVYARGDGALTRTLPKAHGRFSNMYASTITNIVGRKAGDARASLPGLEAEPLDTYGVWDQYLLTVEFTPRPYDVLDDASISLAALPYFKEDSTPATAAVWDEWKRWTDYRIEGGAELITAQKGMMQFFTADGEPPNGTTFSGFPRMIVPGCTVVYSFSNVPWSYIDSDNSYIMGYQGYINQLDWDGWAAGSLLYLKPVVAHKYMPPLPKQVANPGGVGFSRAKTCDIELHFLYTKRTVESPPVPYNKNWLAAGHNCPPWLADRTFRYAANVATDPVTKAPDPANQVPTFLSFPFQLLFTDPDYSQP